MPNFVAKPVWIKEREAPLSSNTIVGKSFINIEIEVGYRELWFTSFWLSGLESELLLLFRFELLFLIFEILLTEYSFSIIIPIKLSFETFFSESDSLRFECFEILSITVALINFLFDKLLAFGLFLFKIGLFG